MDDSRDLERVAVASRGPDLFPLSECSIKLRRRALLPAMSMLRPRVLPFCLSIAKMDRVNRSSVILAPGLHVEWVGEEAVVLDPESGQLHYLNPPAALVFALVGEMGYERALEQLRRSHGDVPDLEEDVRRLVDDLKERGLLAEGRTPDGRG